MNKQTQTACVFGGTGFLGRYIVQKLAREGVRIKIATRTPQSAYFLRPYGDVGQIVPVMCDYSQASIENMIEDCDIVVNCVGILYEKGKNSFKKIHTDLPSTIAKACRKHNVARFVHISALGVNSAGSKYAKSKLKGEEKVLSHFEKAAILRPSVVFGAEDEFFNRFAAMMRFLPFLPLIGGDKPVMQPVYVNDVAQAVHNVVFGDEVHQGRVYSLAGPEKMGFARIYGIIFEATNRWRPLVRLPFWLAKIQAFFLQLLPGAPLLTVDQVRSLQTPNILQEGQLSLTDLGITPTGHALIVPQYLKIFAKGQRGIDSAHSANA